MTDAHKLTDEFTARMEALGHAVKKTGALEMTCNGVVCDGFEFDGNKKRSILLDAAAVIKSMTDNLGVLTR